MRQRSEKKKKKVRREPEKKGRRENKGEHRDGNGLRSSTLP
jgi:hypothetical protein